MHEERRLRREGTGSLVAEHAARLLVGLLDVFEAPRRPERLRHGPFLPAILHRRPAPSYTGDTMSYALKLGGAAIVFLLLGFLGIVLFDAVWARVGLVAALIIVFGGILLFAWNVDRKDKAKRAGLDELPDV
jgi:hypothetical protein